jgi:putative phosphoesterase
LFGPLQGVGMRVGIFADTHDHLPNIRLAVERFNAERVDVVLFAGDFVSTISVPPLRNLKAPMVACFGDNEGNKIGLRSGFKLIGQLSEPPVYYIAQDGTRFVIAHMKRQLRGIEPGYDIAVFGHTHKPRIESDSEGRLLINPGETSGWSFGRSTIVILETATRATTVIDLTSPQECETGH